MTENNEKSEGITLIWENLTASVKQKVILDNVSGYCRPGQMLAIMGPSGAGKTTLLSLLASKKNSSLSTSGCVLANNSQFLPKQFYNFGVYIFQNDILHANLTVEQTLKFISYLQFTDKSKAHERTQQMIATFQLQKCKDTIVGGQYVKGISGGEKKRLCIAVEMIADPKVLILDEPTSGLDSHKVKSVIKVLKKLATEKNKTVIFTLHQPSFLIYNELDRLLLLNKGQSIFQGKSQQILSYMQNQLNISIPLNLTISDFFMLEISQFKQIKKSYTTPLNHQNYCLKLKPTLDQQLLNAKQSIPLEGFRQLFTQLSFIQELIILLKRQWLIFVRNPMKGVRLVMISLVIVVIAGLVFLKGISDNRPQNGQIVGYKELEKYLIKAQGTSYVAVLSCIMSNVNTVALNFPNDKEIYYKQTSSKKYRPTSYLVAKIITEVGLCMIGAIIMATGEYFLIGYTVDFLQFLKYVLTLMICCVIGNSLGLTVGTLFKDARRASALTPLLLMPLMMFSGMYSRLDSLPKWIGWIQYISPFKYGLHALLNNQFKDQKYIVNIADSFFYQFDYRKDLQIELDFWQNVFVLLGLIVFFYSIAFMLLKKLSSNLAP